MKTAYPIVITQGKEYMVVYIPDFNCNTQGKDIADAMEMARDAIGVMGIDMEDENEMLPPPTNLTEIKEKYPNDIATLVDVDFVAYRRAHDMRSIRKNCTIPVWLNDLAEKNSVNFSAALQDGLKRQLHISD